MELNSKLVSLEEEVTVLKGEIRAILQEIRTSVLARDNPFTAHEAAAPLQVVESLPSELTPAPPVVEPTAAAPEPPARLRAAASREPVPEVPEPDAPPRRPAWDVRSIAALIAWVEEAGHRFDSAQLGVVLGLARYGGIIDADLEATLLRLGAEIPMPAKTEAPAPSDYIMALRTLEATVGGVIGDDLAALRFRKRQTS